MRMVVMIRRVVMEEGNGKWAQPLLA